MNKIELHDLDTTIYHEKLENGLDVFVVPNHQGNNIYATYSTKLGSVYNEFIPKGENEFISVPDGIAHFLEHKVFEQEDGTDPFEFFASHGASANANTTNYKTTYLFQTTKDIDENLEYLLNYVESPYFTEENVSKEQGIIKQELLMYDDDPYWKLFETTLFNSFKEHPIRYPIGGTVESISEINKDLLYLTYETFYHPRNMFLVVTGDVDHEHIFELVKKCEAKRKVESLDPVRIKLVDEPNEVSKKHEELKMDITIPKVCVAYKINFKELKNITLRNLKKYISFLLDINFGGTSLFLQELKEEGLITDGFGIDTIYTDRHVLIMISSETKNPTEVIKKIEDKMLHLDCTLEELERMKKVGISSNIVMTDNIYAINNKIMADIINEGEVMDNVVGEIKKLNLKELKSLLGKFDFKNKTVTIIKPLEEKE